MNEGNFAGSIERNVSSLRTALICAKWLFEEHRPDAVNIIKQSLDNLDYYQCFNSVENHIKVIRLLMLDAYLWMTKNSHYRDVRKTLINALYFARDVLVDMPLPYTLPSEGGAA